MSSASAGAVTLQVLGSGSALPGHAISTDELLGHFAEYLPIGAANKAKRIARRLGIENRHIARALREPVEAVNPEHSAPQLAARATHAALQQAGMPVASLGFLIGHTATPHTPLPSNTAWTADVLEYPGPHVELRQACTGFAAAVVLANGPISSSRQPVAIAGSETGSVYFDPRLVTAEPDQLVNMVQMGDGAGAIILGPLLDTAASRIEIPYFGSLGLGRAPGLMLGAGGSSRPQIGNGGLAHFSHDYAAIREHGMDLLRAGLDAAEGLGVHRDSVDWFLPHQANGRMAELCAAHLHLPAERVICDAKALGNLGSAAIWVSLDRLRRSGRLARGDRVLVLGAEATKFMYGGFLYVHGRS